MSTESNHFADEALEAVYSSVSASEWDPDPVTNSILAGINAEDQTVLFDRLHSQIETPEGGIAHAVLRESGQDVQNGQAIMSFVQFAHGPWDNVILHAEVMRRHAYASGFTDEKGDPLPLVLVGHGTPDNPVELTATETIALEFGDFSPIVAKQLDAVADYAEQWYVHGFSHGGNLVLPAAADLIEVRSKEVLVAAPADQTQSKKRNLAGFGRDFILRDGVRFQISDRKHMGVPEQDVLKEHIKSGKTPQNRAALAGMGANKFAQNLSDALLIPDQDFPIVIGVGEISAIGALKHVIDDVAEVASLMPKSMRASFVERVSLIRIDEMAHGWSDRMRPRTAFMKKFMEAARTN